MGSISVILPALNEERALRPSVEMFTALFAEAGVLYEIILIDDGSTDGTPAIADELARANPEIRVVHHAETRGLGHSYCEGVGLARMDYLILLTANGECDRESIRAIVDCRGRADIILPYPGNLGSRPMARRIASRAFTWTLNRITGHDLPYYNGTVLHRTALLRSISIRTSSYAYQADALLQLLAAGASYHSVRIRVAYRPHRTKAFRLRNIAGVGAFLARAVWETWG